MMKIFGFILIGKYLGGSIIKFGEMELKENNVLVLNFDKYGIVIQKKFL